LPRQSIFPKHPCNIDQRRQIYQSIARKSYQVSLDMIVKKSNTLEKMVSSLNMPSKPSAGNEVLLGRFS